MRYPKPLPPPRLCFAGLFLSLCLILPGSAFAVTLTGVVRTEAGVAVGNVDVDFIDECSGDNVFLASDHTAADGTFSISIAAGTYDVHFIPPVGSTTCAADLQSVVVSVSASLGTITLHPGRLVSGTVLTPSLGAAAGVDLKFVDTIADHRVFLSKTVTDVAGHYSVRVPPGTYDVDFRPAAGSAFADAERLNLVVGTGDIAGLSDVLTTGFVVTGTVRGQSNSKLKNVDIDLFDDCTGRRIPNAHDNTDVNGVFSVIAPAGSYTLAIDPPVCDGVESTRLNGIVIAGATALGTFTLKAAVSVSGTILDPNGLPLAGAKVKFYDVTAVGAPRQGASNDRTDVNGQFDILVPDNTYDVNIEPPVGVNALVYHINNLTTGAGGIDIGFNQLAAGMAISGHVQGPGSAPQLNVNINILDQFTRVAQRVSHDNTDANGDFTVYVNPGVYDIHFDTPACGGMAPAQLEGVAVGAPTVLPVTNLVTGVHVLGTVTDPGSAAVVNADLDVYPAGGASKLYTPGDKTTATGSYDLLLPPGTYDVRYIPAAPTRLRPAVRSNTALPSTQTLPVTVLQNGLLLSGTVHAENTLLPLSGVEVQLYPPNGVPALWAPHASSHLLGDFSFSVEPGTYDIRYLPPIGSFYQESWRYGVSVGGDLSLGDQILRFPNTGVGPAPSHGLALAAPSPNPARRHVSLTFSTPAGAAELSAWDVAGRKVATLWHGRSLTPVTVQWDGSRDGGGALPAGLYLVRLADDHGSVQMRRITLLQ